MINRPFSTIKSNVANNVQDTSSSMDTIIGKYINDAYADLLRRINWRAIDDDYNFSLSSNEQVLPDNFGKALKVWDSTNKLPIVETTIEREVDNRLSTIDQTGTVERYVILERLCRKHPSSASVLELVSSSAGDTTQSVVISGINGSGSYIVESVLLTGTTPVSTTNSYTRIMGIAKSATTTGTVTITSNSGGVTNALIAPSVLDYRVRVMRFYATPSSTITVFAPYLIQAIPLSNSYDVPVIDCADILELMATASAWRYKRQFAKANDMDNKAERAINTLIWDKENSPNLTHMINFTPYSRDIS